MFWADQVGLAKIRDAMLRYCDSVGREYWQPAAMIDRLADENRGFYATGKPGPASSSA